MGRRQAFSDSIPHHHLTLVPRLSHRPQPPPLPRFAMSRRLWQTPNRLLSSSSSSSSSNTPRLTMTSDAPPIYFGPFEVTKQVFLQTAHSFALVNLKPLLPGHVLVCPRTAHTRLTDLAPPELTDLFTTVQRVQALLARRFFRPPPPSTAPPPPPQLLRHGAFNVALQDGPGAGQTVPHVHVHVIPRVAGAGTAPDGAGEGDVLYERMASEEGNVGGALWDAARGGGARPTPGGAFGRVEDWEREARSAAEMEAEAAEFRALLEEMEG